MRIRTHPHRQPGGITSARVILDRVIGLALFDVRFDLKAT